MGSNNDRRLLEQKKFVEGKSEEEEEEELEDARGDEVTLMWSETEIKVRTVFYENKRARDEFGERKR